MMVETEAPDACTYLVQIRGIAEDWNAHPGEWIRDRPTHAQIMAIKLLDQYRNCGRHALPGVSSTWQYGGDRVGYEMRMLDVSGREVLVVHRRYLDEALARLRKKLAELVNQAIMF